MNNDRLQACLEKLLHEYSPTKKERSVAAVIKQMLRNFNISFYEDNTAELTGSDTGNIIVGGSRCAKICFCAHMDTINIYRNNSFIIDNGTVRGQNGGVIGLDDKSGIAVLIEAMACMQENGGIPEDIHFIFTTCEEDRFLGAKYVDERHFADAYNFVVDSGGLPIGYTVIQGVSQYDFSVSITGDMSHTGNPKALNSLVLSAELIGLLKKGRVSDDTFINIANIYCEGNPNTIPEFTSFSGQLLSYNDSEAERLLRDMSDKTKEFSKEHSCMAQCSHVRSCKGFYTNEQSDIVKYAQHAAESAGLKFQIGKTGAGSDAHMFVQRGAKAIKISNGMMNVHSNDEHVQIKDMANCVNYVLSLAAGQFCD